MIDRSLPRLFLLRVLVVAVLLTLGGRLWFLQVHAGDGYAEAASANRVRTVVTPAPRGEVVDVQGRLLVGNRTALVVSVDRSRLLREPGDGAPVLDRLAPVVGLTPAQLVDRITPCGTRLSDGRTLHASDGCWAGSPYQPVPVATYDARDPDALAKVLVVEESREDYPGVSTSFAAVRDYPRGTLGAHVLGYLGQIDDTEVGLPGYAGVRDDALIGRSGVEQTYEDRLRGVDGTEELLVDSGGSVTGTARSTPARPGGRLVLSLDAGVQEVAERELAAAVLQARTRQAREGKGLLVADSGSVVVLEAKTGRVVALASYPTYDPAQFTGGISTQDYAALVDPARGSPLLFRATQGGYAPASTFKVVSAAAAVENGQTTFNAASDCPGTFGPTGQRNFEAADLGALTLRSAIVRSCDTNFYKFAYDAWLRDGGNRPVPQPTDPMINTALAFGLGARTGVDLPGESAGVIPTRQWRQQYWEAVKGDACEGARNTAFDAERRARNRDACADGFRFRGGQATNFAIGQGETVVTPLQLASVYATIANGGEVRKPTVARAVVSPDGVVTDIAPTVTRMVPVRPETLAALREALTGVTSEPGGTGRGAFAGLPLAVAGKTGTAQVAGKQDTSWFASFAPADDPQLVVVGMVSQGGTGGSTAAPLVRKVYEGIYGLGGRKAALPGGRLPSELPVVRPEEPAAVRTGGRP